MLSPTPIFLIGILSSSGKGKRDTALGSAVEFGNDQTGEPDGFVENLRLFEGVLACGGIDHEEYFMRRKWGMPTDHTDDLFQLIHEIYFVVQPSGGIEQEHIDVSSGRGFECIEGDRRRVGVNMLAYKIRTRSVGPDSQLFDGTGPEGIARAEHHPLALSGIGGGDFTDRRGLPDAVDADHEHYLRFYPGKGRLSFKSQIRNEKFLERGIGLQRDLQPLAPDLPPKPIDNGL